MIGRLFTAIIMMLVCSTAMAEHHAVYRLFCVTDDGARRLKSVSIYDPKDTMTVYGEWHGASEILDPETGVRAWLEENLGPEWRTHKTLVLSKTTGRCPSQLGS